MQSCPNPGVSFFFIPNAPYASASLRRLPPSSFSPFPLFSFPPSTPPRPRASLSLFPLTPAQVLSNIPDQDTFYDVTDSLERLGMESLILKHMSKQDADLDLLAQFQIYEVSCIGLLSKKSLFYFPKGQARSYCDIARLFQIQFITIRLNEKWLGQIHCVR